jgi:hypothetical protein
MTSEETARIQRRYGRLITTRCSMISDLPRVVVQHDLQPKNLFQTPTTAAPGPATTATVVENAQITVIDVDWSFRTTRLAELFFLLSGADEVPIMAYLGTAEMIALFGRNLIRYVAASGTPFTTQERRLLPHVLAYKASAVMRHMCKRGKDHPAAVRNARLFLACIDYRDDIRRAMDVANERLTSMIARAPGPAPVPPS